MTDSDDTGGHVTAAYADIRFVRPIGMRPVVGRCGPRLARSEAAVTIP